LYFFDSFNAATFNFANPTANANTRIGGKGGGDLMNTYASEEGWLDLAGIYSPTSTLTFGMRVAYDFGPVWLYSGFDANTMSIDGVSVTSTNSRIFTSGTTPLAPADNEVNNTRAISRFGVTYAGGTFVGFEDDIFTPDLDFNDGVFQIRGFAVAVPEPTSLALLAAGLLGLGVAARRRRQ